MKTIRIAIIGLICGVPFSLLANTVSQEFVSLVENINSYEAKFTQNIKDDMGEVISSMQGEIKVLRPGKFYWKSAPPDAILVVADGQFLWTYDIELEQVTKQELALALSTSPAAILMGSTHQILTDFTVSKYNDVDCQAETSCFALKPKADSEMFQDIKVIFKNKKLMEVRMDDPLGQHVKTEFTQVSVNNKIQEAVFQFSPPQGIDVIIPGT